MTTVQGQAASTVAERLSRLNEGAALGDRHPMNSWTEKGMLRGVSAILDGYVPALIQGSRARRTEHGGESRGDRDSRYDHGDRYARSDRYDRDYREDPDDRYRRERARVISRRSESPDRTPTYPR